MLNHRYELASCPALLGAPIDVLLEFGDRSVDMRFYLAAEPLPHYWDVSHTKHTSEPVTGY